MTTRLKLNLEDLKVESFAAGRPIADPRGTVLGQMTIHGEESCGHTNCWNSTDSCANTCEGPGCVSGYHPICEE